MCDWVGPCTRPLSWEYEILRWTVAGKGSGGKKCSVPQLYIPNMVVSPGVKQSLTDNSRRGNQRSCQSDGQCP